MFTAMTHPQPTRQAFELGGRGLADQQDRAPGERVTLPDGVRQRRRRPPQGGVSGQIRYAVGGC
jgi:hypothetical protein